MSRSVAVIRRRVDERALSTLYRAHNLKAYPLILLVLCGAMPLFALLDYYLVGLRSGPALRDLFVAVDLSLAGFYAALLGLFYIRPAFVRRHVVAFLLIASHAILVAQLYLIGRAGDGAEPYIMVSLILAQALLIQLKPRAAVLNLMFIGAYCAPLMIFAWPLSLPLSFLPPLLAVLALGVTAVIYRNALLSRHIDTHRKNRILSRSLRQVNELKRRQDGDYFLTSLLIKPLGGNHVDTPRVSVDILTRQKKAFRFRKWDVEIGGDLSTAYRVRLQNRN
ncbi:MAG: hypothetical protein RIF32_18910, partial [Leptospirales bacterium]